MSFTILMGLVFLFFLTPCLRCAGGKPWLTKKGFPQEAFVAGRGASLSLLAEPPCRGEGPGAGWCGVIKLTLSPTLDNALYAVDFPTNSVGPKQYVILYTFFQKRQAVFQNFFTFSKAGEMFTVLCRLPCRKRVK
jgi:hypothetical protein